MNSAALLAIKSILLSIHRLSGAALALLEDGDDTAASALEKIRTFGDTLNEANNGE